MAKNALFNIEFEHDRLKSHEFGRERREATVASGHTRIPSEHSPVASELKGGFTREKTALLFP
jgi:hypothetical protein